jgi:carbon-monoxide dehydrogenase large subunit
VLKQFADNFAAQVKARAEQQAAAGAPSPAAAEASPSPAREAASPPPAARELNGLALLWAVFRDWLRDLLRRRRA